MDKREKIASKIMQIMRIHHKKVMHKGGHDGMSRHRMMVLGHIEKHNGLTMSCYGKELMISKPNMSNLINTFYEQGFIERIPDENDRRVTKICITEKGKEEFKKGKKIVLKEMSKNLDELTDDEIEELNIHYDRIIEIMSKL